MPSPAKKTGAKNQLSPNHINHLRNTLRASASNSLPHPLMVPPPASPAPAGAGDDTMIPAKTGEYVIPEPVVRLKGVQFFDNLVKKTLAEVMPPEEAAQGGEGSPEQGYWRGGEVGDGTERFGRGFNFFGGRSGPSYIPRAMTQYQEAVDPHPNFWNQPPVPRDPNVFVGNRNNPNPPRDFFKTYGDRMEAKDQYPNINAQGLYGIFNGGYGLLPFNGGAISGPTISPTFWSNANTGGNWFAPVAIPTGGWTPGNVLNIGTSRHSIRPETT